MKYPIDRYIAITGMTSQQLAEKLSGLGENTYGAKTVWNWINGRYKFHVVIEVDDKDIDEIKGAYKEYRIV